MASLWDILGLSGQQQPQQDPTIALMQSMGMQIDPQAAQAFQQSQQQGQNYARSMGMLTGGFGIMGAPGGRFNPMGAVTQGVQQGLQTSQGLQQQQQQKQMQGMQMFGALQQLKQTQMQMQSQQAIADVAQKLVGARISDPTSLKLIMDRMQGEALAKSFSAAAQQASLRGDSNKAQIFSMLAQTAPSNPEKAKELALKYTTTTSEQEQALKLRESGAELNKMKADLIKSILGGTVSLGTSPAGTVPHPAKIPGVAVDPVTGKVFVTDEVDKWLKGELAAPPETETPLP